MIDLIKHKRDLAGFIYDFFEGMVNSEKIEEAINEYIDNEIEFSNEDKQHKEDLDEEQDTINRELYD